MESWYLTFFYTIFRDIRKFKDTKKQFDRVREDMELAQVKNAQAPRNKVHEAEEATQALILSRKAFRHLALDYVLQVKQKYNRWCYCHAAATEHLVTLKLIFYSN